MGGAKRDRIPATTGGHSDEERGEGVGDHKLRRFSRENDPLTRVEASSLGPQVDPKRKHAPERIPSDPSTWTSRADVGPAQNFDFSDSRRLNQCKL